MLQCVPLLYYITHSMIIRKGNDLIDISHEFALKWFYLEVSQFYVVGHMWPAMPVSSRDLLCLQSVRTNQCSSHAPT